MATKLTSRAEDDETAAARQTASLAGLAAVLCLVILALQLIHVLRTNAAIEDCLLAGHQNCDAIVPSR